MSSYCSPRLRRPGRDGRGLPLLPGRDQPQHPPPPVSLWMTAAEWAVFEPVLPPPAWLAGRGGGSAGWCMRDVVDAIRYLTHNGPVWRALLLTSCCWMVYYWASKWQADGSTARMHDDLRERVRLVAGRADCPTAGSIDSQSVKAADTVGADSRGYDAGKRINGRKRHIAVDSLGLLLTVIVTAASVQDRDGAFRLLAVLRERLSTITLVWADGGYAGRLVDLGEDRPASDPGNRQAAR